MESWNLDRYIEEVLGSQLDEDEGETLALSAITDEKIFEDFNDRNVTDTKEQGLGEGGLFCLK